MGLSNSVRTSFSMKIKTKIQNGLRAASRVVHLDLRYYLPGSFWLTSSYVISILLSLTLSVLFARLASQTLYGQYRFALSFFSLLAILSLPGLNLAMVRAIANGRDDAFMHGTGSKFKFSCLAAIPLLGMAWYLLVFKESSLGWAFVIAAPLFPLTYGFANSAYFTGKKRFRDGGVLLVVQRGFMVFLVGVTLMVTHNVVLVIFAYLLAQAIVNISVYQRIRRSLPYREPRGDTHSQGSSQRDFIRYGQHLTAMRIISTVAGQLDKLLLAYFLGFQHVAIYAIATTIPEAAKGIFKQISSLVLPRLAGTPKDKVYYKIRTKVLHLFLLGIFSAAVLWIILPHLIPLVYTSKYAGAVFPAQILALSLLFVPLIQTLRSALVSHQATRQLYMFYTIVPITRTLLVISLIPLWGVTGAALSLLLSRAVQAGYLYFAVRRMGS